MELREGPARAGAIGIQPGRFRTLLRQGFSAHGLLLGLAFAYLALFQLLSLAVPGVRAGDAGEVMLGILFFSVPAVLFGLMVYLFIHMAAVDKPDRPLLALYRRMKAVLSDPERMAAGIPAAIALVIFMFVFTMLKASVSVLVPFSWDVTFDRWDTILHFGYRPWELLQPVFGWWPITFLVNLNYNMWFVVMNVFWAYYAFIARPGPERTRFFLSYMGIWMVGGGLMAVLFSSAGPCYFTRLGISPDPYAPLMAYLAEANTHAPIWALGTQDMLWNLKLEGSGFGGVSAMPSMHNATALLFVLMCPWKSVIVNRLLVAHMVLILLGSVHLGWHYAVDGYVAIALALWAAMGPVARWWEDRAACRDFSAVAGGA
ncbi:phosphatase PAP2 family protein [Aestuariivirga sp.]|uniref:phosphatase PAP2 family protein n=1 Tax=Aestuariivirga sp. TaxID=2650926 RepID=UPI0035936ED8